MNLENVHWMHSIVTLAWTKSIYLAKNLFKTLGKNSIEKMLVACILALKKEKNFEVIEVLYINADCI